MNDNKIIKIAAAGFIGLVVLPIVVDTTISAISLAATGISSINNKIKYNRKIKKGLKDGSIVEIDGEYYEVTVDEA